MGYDDRPALDAPGFGETWVVRAALWAVRRFLPAEGWVALLACLTLALLPAYALHTNHWIRLPATRDTLAALGALGVLFTWWVMGWGRAWTPGRARLPVALLTVVAVILAGLLVTSLLFARWAPGPAALWSALVGRDPSPVLAPMSSALERYAARVAVWWVGARSGGAPADEIVFGSIAGLLLWFAAAAGAALARRTRSGLAAAAPVLALVGTIVFFGGAGRSLFVTALGVGLLLHVALDNRVLLDRWSRLQLDHSDDLLLERWLNAASLGAAALLLAAVAPSLSVRSLADLYARWVAPIDERIETVREEVFPNIETAPRFAVAGTATGMPNAFLLGAGPELDEARILLLRTSDAPVSYQEPSAAPYLRALALSDYSGLGWSRPENADHEQLPANTRRPGVEDGPRRILAQTVRTYLPSRTLFAAGEPVEASVDSRLELDAQGQLVAMTSGAGGYTVLSAVPALADEALAALPAWSDANPLPPGFAHYQTLPESVPQRTRALATDLTSGLETPYAQARAIEAHLRTIPYDLEIGAPPPGVVDVADYFLFDLQRGYCDYYATAFVVLARAVGLPARFATGYATGDWQPDASQWLVTAADAHAWPEVYLPQVGWVPFEPTAYRPLLQRTGQGALAPPSAALAAPPQESGGRGIDWNAQMLFWLLPPAALLWAGWTLLARRRAAREDPWHALMAWGRRMGRPPQPGETILEYAAALASLASGLRARSPDALRAVEREAQALGRAVSTAHYAPAAARPAARAEIAARWQRLRPWLPRLRPSRHA